MVSLSSDGTSHKNHKEQLITDLPDEVLVNVAKHLPKSSAALFAVALTAPSSSWRKRNWHQRPVASGLAIVEAVQWDVLDFGGPETDLAKKLTEEDLIAVLACLGAVKKLKHLKLAGCINAIGLCSGPVRGSTALKLIDLGMAKQHPILRVRKSRKVSGILLPRLTVFIIWGIFVILFICIPSKCKRILLLLLVAQLVFWGKWGSPICVSVFCSIIAAVVYYQ